MLCIRKATRGQACTGKNKKNQTTTDEGNISHFNTMGVTLVDRPHQARNGVLLCLRRLGDMLLCSSIFSDRHLLQKRKRFRRTDVIHLFPIVLCPVQSPSQMFLSETRHTPQTGSQPIPSQMQTSIHAHIHHTRLESSIKLMCKNCENIIDQNTNSPNYEADILPVVHHIKYKTAHGQNVFLFSNVQLLVSSMYRPGTNQVGIHFVVLSCCLYWSWHTNKVRASSSGPNTQEEYIVC